MSEAVAENLMPTHEELVAALRAANDAAKAARGTVDGGTCNMDTPVLFTRRREAFVAKAAAEAGVIVRKGSWMGRVCYFVQVEYEGQGDMRTRMVEAATKALKAAGLAAQTYYQMD